MADDAQGDSNPDKGGLLEGSPYAGDADGEKLKNWDYIGACYDALLIDPLDPLEGRKGYGAFEFTEFERVADGRYLKPVGTIHLAAPGGSYDRRVLQMSSMYDFKSTMATMGSITVSDPTGAAFASTLSTSYTRTRRDTEERESVVTYAVMRTNLFELRIAGDEHAPNLSPDLHAALAVLPSTVNDSSHTSFISTFGTHYARRVVSGGLATQRITLSRHEYEGFLSQGVNLEAQFSATFEIAKAEGKGSYRDERDEHFKNANSLEVEMMKFVGGNSSQTDFNMWSMSVKEEPGPGAVDFEPLYSLLTADRFPSLDAVDDKREALRRATESYLSSRGCNTAVEILCDGDAVTLQPLDGRSEGLLARQGNAVEVVRVTETLPPEATWSISALPPSTDPGSQLPSCLTIALRNKKDGSYLDAQAGQDGEYDLGDGLVGLSSPAAPGDTVTWKLALTATERSCVVDGDYIHLRSAWRDDDGNIGYLWCDPQQPLTHRNVFSFGHTNSPGTIWRIVRVRVVG